MNKVTKVSQIAIEGHFINCEITLKGDYELPRTINKAEFENWLGVQKDGRVDLPIQAHGYYNADSQDFGQDKSCYVPIEEVYENTDMMEVLVKGYLAEECALDLTIALCIEQGKEALIANPFLKNYCCAINNVSVEDIQRVAKSQKKEPEYSASLKQLRTDVFAYVDTRAVQVSLWSVDCKVETRILPVNQDKAA